MVRLQSAINCTPVKWMDKHILKESAQRLRENMKISVENGLEQGFKHFQKDWVYMYDMFSERGFDLK